MIKPLTIGLDVGSTTVKAVVCNQRMEILWCDYQRHEARQHQKVFELLDAIHRDLGAEQLYQVFITGSGGAGLVTPLRARFVQEVNAVSLAVEHRHPGAGSVVELGGQDAKMIIFKKSEGQGRKRKILSMNDKCAGGTGTVIDKIRAKLNIKESALLDYGYDGIETHAVAAKCGVFAETDINGLQKNGVPRAQLIASLYDAIVLQNLTVLSRGNTLEPEVILLGGPNLFLPGLQQAWRYHIAKIWQERGQSPVEPDLERLIYVPDDAQYYAAIGAIYSGLEAMHCAQPGLSLTPVLKASKFPVELARLRSSGRGLSACAQELDAFRQSFATSSRQPAKPIPDGGRLSAYLGLDSGSTSTKAVLIDAGGSVLYTAYRLSCGNPIDDAKLVLDDLRRSVKSDQIDLVVDGCVTTGYAKDVLRAVIAADAALVETVAHTQAALHFYPDVDVICDVGGQDIKIIMLKGGMIKDFRLNTQCSAGNGYFLQNTAEALGIPVEEYAERAFRAKNYPEFSYGCSVFMQSDIVDFQRQGWHSDEILAGLATVLPKNIWLYVAAIPNLATLGRHFLLQGGTQKNLAAVKAQIDFIRSRFSAKNIKPEIEVHPYCAESGALGAALEARSLASQGQKSSFIGFDAVQDIRYRIFNDARTVCHFCKNECQRTFIDVAVAGASTQALPAQDSLIPVLAGEVRIISGNSCEKGLVEQVKAMRVVKNNLEIVSRLTPNLIDYAARQVWKSPMVAPLKLPRLVQKLTAGKKQADYARDKVRIGIPRVLNYYSVNPLFRGYFESLGLASNQIIYSSFSDETLYRAGARRSSIDPCYPSKLAISHVHQLMFGRGKRKPPHMIFLPMINTLDSTLSRALGHWACPTVTATPEVVKAAMTKERDLFVETGIQFINPMLSIANEALFERQMFATFESLLGVSRYENRVAVRSGFEALRQYKKSLRAQGRIVLDNLVKNNQIGIVLLGRAYHNDPGINHEIPEQLQALGYPILSLDSLPQDDDILAELFSADIEQGRIDHALDISDVWKNAYSENGSQKVWAAKFIARHPHLVALEISSFKCGHDAPLYSLIEKIIESSGTPYFCFKDLDENRPSASIRIRLETIDYFLQRYRTSQLEPWQVSRQIKTRLQQYEAQLRSESEPVYGIK